MKKFLILVAAVAMATFTSCTSCKDSTPVKKDKIELASNVALNVERITSADREFMFINHGGNYRWFETCMKLNNFLDEENDGSLEEVVNVFQVVTEYEGGKSFDVMVYKFQHFADGTACNDSIAGFWVEDQPMNDDAIKITYQQAYEKLMQTNCPKPHSRYCTLRKQVGPVDANPQYIFGNIRDVVFVDAVTGEVSTENPAFPKGFKMPLGEWP